MKVFKSSLNDIRNYLRNEVISPAQNFSVKRKKIDWNLIEYKAQKYENDLIQSEKKKKRHKKKLQIKTSQKYQFQTQRKNFQEEILDFQDNQKEKKYFSQPGTPISIGSKNSITLQTHQTFIKQEMKQKFDDKPQKLKQFLKKDFEVKEEILPKLPFGEHKSYNEVENIKELVQQREKINEDKKYKNLQQLQKLQEKRQKNLKMVVSDAYFQDFERESLNSRQFPYPENSQQRIIKREIKKLDFLAEIAFKQPKNKKKYLKKIKTDVPKSTRRTPIKKRQSLQSPQSLQLSPNSSLEHRFLYHYQNSDLNRQRQQQKIAQIVQNIARNVNGSDFYKVTNLQIFNIKERKQSFIVQTTLYSLVLYQQKSNKLKWSFLKQISLKQTQRQIDDFAHRQNQKRQI